MWIKPYKSVGPLKFNMSPKEVEGLIGPPSDSQKRLINVLTEFRFGKTAEEIKPSVRYQKLKVSSIAICDTIPNVEFNGFRIFDNKKK